MTVQNKKRSMVALMVILIVLVVTMKLTGRFASYGWVALIWLGIVVLSIFKITFAKNKDYLSKSNFVIGGFFSSLAFVLAIGGNYTHPVKVLLAYLPLHFYLIYYVVTKKPGEESTGMVMGLTADAAEEPEPIEREKMDLSSEIRQKCRQYIGEDEMPKAIDLLIENLSPNGPNYNDALQIRQKWNRVERDKNLNTISPDDADRQFSRMVQTLLDILDD